MTRYLPLLTPVGAVLFTVAWAVLSAVSPGYRLFDMIVEDYSAVSQPISGLGLGVTAPFMNTAFVLGGLLISMGLIASIRPLRVSRLATAGLVLMAMIGVGMAIDGVFTLESVFLHLIGFLIAVPVPALGFLLLGLALRRSRPALGTSLIVGGPVAAVLFVIFMVTFDPYSAGDNTGYSGVLQRVLVTLMLVLMTAVAVAAARTVARARSISV